MFKLYVINLLERIKLGYKYKWAEHSFYVFHNNSETSDLKPKTGNTRISRPTGHAEYMDTQDQQQHFDWPRGSNYKKQLRGGWETGLENRIEMKRKRKKMAYTNKSYGIMS